MKFMTYFRSKRGQKHIMSIYLYGAEAESIEHKGSTIHMSLLKQMVKDK